MSLLGSSVINRGLDTLETLGKKTMEVLQEGDPGLKKKRAMLFADQDKPVLSQVITHGFDIVLYGVLLYVSISNAFSLANFLWKNEQLLPLSQQLPDLGA